MARDCAAAASAIMREGFGRVGVSAVKGRGNVLTETDLAVEQAVGAILAREYPGHALLSEETAAETRSDGWLWVVDPVDGTKNFSRGIPHFCFTMALCHAMAPVVGLTVHPLLGEEFAAVAGQGATLNGEPIHVSGVETVDQAVFAADLGYEDTRGKHQLEIALGLWPGMQALRITGSAGLGFAYAAAGRWDLFVHASLQPWDLAAGIVLVREAGGVITGRDGEPISLLSEGAIGGAPGVHADFLSLAGGRQWRS